MQLNPYDPQPLFRLDGMVAAVTGGTGVLCSAMGHVLVASGAHVVILGRSLDKANGVAQAICAEGGTAVGVAADVLSKRALQDACNEIVRQFGRVDILINGAGGNNPGATTSAEQTFFDLDVAAVERVFGLNFNGIFIASQVFAKQMALQKSGVILNVASMASLRPLTRVPAYGSAKAAVINFTQWLAVHMAQEYSPAIRVNALAPGFFLTEQNRFLMVDPATGESTPRGKKILEHTPMNRLGSPSDLFGAMLWLVSPASSFVTGITVPVDGGFSAYSGV